MRKATRIQREGGVTRISLRNGELLNGRKGAPVWVRLCLHPDHWYVTQAGYSDGSSHTFTGFSWGYAGEGSRGLAEWTKANDVPLEMREIALLPNNHEDGVAVVWEWTP